MPGPRENYSNFKYVHALDTLFADATTNGITVDTKGYETVTMVVVIGRCSHVSTLSYWQLRLQHASQSTAGIDAWADCVLSELVNISATSITSGVWKKIITDVAASTSLQGSLTYKVGYRGNKRYVRLVVEELSTPSEINIGAVCILGLPGVWPVNTAFSIDDLN